MQVSDVVLEEEVNVAAAAEAHVPGVGSKSTAGIASSDLPLSRPSKMSSGSRLLSGQGAKSGGFWHTARISAMGFCFTFHADSLWIPTLAWAADNGRDAEFVGTALFVFLGARFIPNFAVALVGARSEYFLLAGTFVGYLVSMMFPNEEWAFFVMAGGAGLSFVRAHLSLHMQASFGDYPEQLNVASKISAATRNAGTITGLVLPAWLYTSIGWTAVAIGGMTAAVVYIILAFVQQRWGTRRRRRSLRSSRSLVVEQRGPGVQQISEAPAALAATEAAAAAAAAASADEPTEEGPPPIKCFHWLLGGAFVATELLFNLGISAVSFVLTDKFEQPHESAGLLMASFTGGSMLFLAVLPSIPCAFLHRGPGNVVFSFGLNVLAWGGAAIAAAQDSEALYYFIAACLLSILTVNLAQTLVLEYLVRELEGNELGRLVAISETIGCGFSAAGGYLGGKLNMLGPHVPLALQSSVALLTAVLVASAIACGLGKPRVIDEGCWDASEEPGDQEKVLSTKVEEVISPASATASTSAEASPSLEDGGSSGGSSPA